MKELLGWLMWFGLGTFALYMPESEGYGWTIIAIGVVATSHRAGYVEGKKEGDRIGSERVRGQWLRERMELVRKGELAPETMWEWAEFHSMQRDTKQQGRDKI